QMLGCSGKIVEGVLLSFPHALLVPGFTVFGSPTDDRDCVDASHLEPKNLRDGELRRLRNAESAADRQVDRDVARRLLALAHEEIDRDTRAISAGHKYLRRPIRGHLERKRDSPEDP